jgi:hypothetical protein
MEIQYGCTKSSPEYSYRWRWVSSVCHHSALFYVINCFARMFGVMTMNLGYSMSYLGGTLLGALVLGRYGGSGSPSLINLN